MSCAAAGRFVAETRHSLAPPAPVAPGLRIGLLGGSFNPAHEGHRHISEVALRRLGLDYVWWLVSPQNPLKPAKGMAPLETRLAGARRCARHPRIVAMDIERRLGTRYTIDTVTALQRRFPQVHFVWVMGSDALDQFHLWRRWQAIAVRLPIAVVTRPGSVLAGLRAPAARRMAPFRTDVTAHFAQIRPPALIVLDGKRSPLSATAIRAANPGNETLVRARPTC
jgi:nicotinate-nucleotide adenylyltransferase